MNQLVYFDIGFETGVPMGRVIVELKCSYNPNLPELFLKVARGEYVQPTNGKRIEYTGTVLHHISSSKRMIMGGDVLFKNGSGGCAPTCARVFQEAELCSTVSNMRGKVVLLPLDYNPTLFNSTFYVLLEKTGPSVVDGCVIGDVVEGIEILDQIVGEYGSENGKPRKKIVIHKCGHL